MEDKRKCRRFALKGINVFAKNIFDNEVEVLDISINGALISSSKRFNIGGNYLFKFEHNKKVFAIKCSVARSTLSGNKADAEGQTIPIYTTGIVFEDLPATKGKQLADFISDTIKSLKEHKIGGVQVTIHLNKALFRYTGKHSIKDISLGGIRIETEEVPQFDNVFDMEIVLAENDVPIYSRGRIAYSEEISGETLKRYIVGLEFIDLSENDKLRIKKFIEEIHFD